MLQLSRVGSFFLCGGGGTGEGTQGQNMSGHSTTDRALYHCVISNCRRVLLGFCFVFWRGGLRDIYVCVCERVGGRGGGGERDRNQGLIFEVQADFKLRTFFLL